MKKLVIATDSFLPRWDGVARFLKEIIPKLSKKYNITVLAPNFGSAIKGFENVRVVRFPILNFQVGDYPPAKLPFSKLKPYIKEADIVWTQSLGSIGASSIIYGKRYKKKVIAYTHSVEWELVSKAVKHFQGITRLITKLFARYLYNKCDALLVPTPNVGAIFRANKIKTPKLVVNLGLDSDKFIPPKDKRLAKKRLNIPPSSRVIGFVGRIVREKDLKTLVKAFRKLKKDNPDLHLLVVGGGILKEFKDIRRKRDAHFTGSKDNVLPYLQAMDVYVLPSLTETTSLSTLEAMSTGLAVITTRVGSIPTYIINKENGLFFKKRSSKDLVKKLELLLKNPPLIAQLGKEARKTIIKRFSWTRTVNEIDDILSSF
jgi:glycosyltransferase involved in cell wall biosynthesis